MMWVNDTLPPRARARWLLMTVRLSHNSLTGTDRTEVAVGTVSDASMFCTVRAGAPRRIVYVGSSLASACSVGGCSLGTGWLVPLAGSAAFDSGRGLATGAGVGVGSTCGSGALLTSCFASGAAASSGAGVASGSAVVVAPDLMPLVLVGLVVLGAPLVEVSP